MNINRQTITLLFAVSLFVALFRLDAVTLFDVDEAVFSTATKEMVASGDWITPTYNGDIRYDKPIFFYWLMAASYKVFGVNEFGARFPSVMAGFLLALSLFWFAKRICNEKIAFYSTMTLSLSAYYLVYCRSAVTDMALSLFITLSLFCFYIAVTEDRRYIYGLYIFSALAFLTKGLIGIVFPFGIAFLYQLTTGGFRGVLKIFDWKAALLFCLVALPWYIAQFAINGDDFFQQFFMKHHFKRYTDVISGHKGPVYYYFITLIIGISPWIVFMPAGIARAARDRKGPMFFALIWFSAIFVFFSFSTTKLPNYILSALPAAAILIAEGMTNLNTRPRKIAWLVIGGGALLAAAGMQFLPDQLVKLGITETGWTIWTSAILVAMSAVAFYSVRVSKPLYAPLACAMFCLLIFLLVSALPPASRYMQEALYNFSVYAGENAPAEERIICYNINNPSVVFYSGHKVANVRGKEGLAQYLAKSRDSLAIAKVRDEADLRAAGFNLLRKEGLYALFKRD
jgi:4-amino-4-deoxy-L-arabinose transferase-like glycosyltransferase